ncbi:hypothetical protein [Rothia sp. L_38]
MTTSLSRRTLVRGAAWCAVPPGAHLLSPHQLLFLLSPLPTTYAN